MAEHAEDNVRSDAAAQTTPDGLAGERARFEKERMNRRAALRRFGIGAGATAFLALGVDDLARLVLGKMQEKHVMDGVTEQVARELHNAGVSFAESTPVTCDHCDNQYCVDKGICEDALANCLLDGGTTTLCAAIFNACWNQKDSEFNACSGAHCPPRHGIPNCATFVPG